MENQFHPLPIIVHPQLMFASLQPEGTQLTLASRLGEMLRMAEYLYGKRDRSYTFLGFEFIPANTRLVHNEERKELIIQLNTLYLNDPILVYCSLAHECIHLLSPLPNPKAETTVLEEGLATFFAAAYMLFVHNQRITISDAPYLRARLLVGKLLDIDRFAIKKLRQKQPTLSLISKNLILRKYPGLPEEVATHLTQEFIYAGDQIAAEYNSQRKQCFENGVYPRSELLSEHLYQGN